MKYLGVGVLVGFPSPCGEKVGINVVKEIGGRNYYWKFPSPCGEKVGINDNNFGLTNYQLAVSVPLRGKGRDQHQHYLVSKFVATTFPSPCGEKVGINMAAI